MDLPKSFCNEMKRILGDEYEEYLSSMNMERKYGLRVNTAKISVEDFLKIVPFQLEPIPYVKNGFYYSSDLQPAKHPYYFAGLYYLQDPSAMTPASRLFVEKGDRVLDLCAAPGGKATELGARLNGSGLLVANDISPKRAKALLKNIEIFGIENSLIVTEYPAKLAQYFENFFDKILIDAPCSGEGMFRKDPAMVKAWEKNGPDFYAKLQEEILSQALPMLREDGYLLYSTCTFSPLEDEGTVAKLLMMDKSLELVEMEGYEGFVEGKPELIEDLILDLLKNDDRSLETINKEIRKCVRIFPHKLDGEGHFLALLHKKKEDDSFEDRETIREKDKKKYNKACGKTGLSKEENKLFEEFEKNLNRKFEKERLDSKNGMIYYISKDLPKLKGIRFLRSGLFMGEMKKNRFEPSQSLAMALKKNEYKNCLNLKIQDERVNRYLRGETLSLTDVEKEIKDGWVLVCLEDFPLGWGKKNKANLKNKYHSGWRMM